MKRKFLSVLLCMGMTSAMLAGCGDSGGSGSAANDGAAESVAPGDSVASGESGAISEVPDAASGVADDSSSEADEDAGTEDDSYLNAELNDYGLTDEQQEALLASVKTAIIEDYLEKYGIAAADFYVNPYDFQDYFDSYVTGVYTGTDPYEWAGVWNTVGLALMGTQWWENESSSNLLVLYEALVDFSVNDADYYDHMEGFRAELKDNLPEQWEASMGVVMDDEHMASQRWALECAVYRGIAEFLKSVGSRECASILGNVYLYSYGEDYADTLLEYPLFDRVLSENLQFE